MQIIYSAADALTFGNLYAYTNIVISTGINRVCSSCDRSFVYNRIRSLMREENLSQNASNEACDLCEEDFTSIGQMLLPRDSRKSISKLGLSSFGNV